MMRYFNLISILSFTLSADSLFSVAIIWCVLLAGGTARSLAIFLCLVTLLVFFINKMSSKLKKQLEMMPRQSFIIIRIVGAVCAILFYPLSLYHHSLALLYASGMIFTVIGFLSQLTSETIIGQAVLSGHLTPNKGSRVIQMAQQIAAFFGPAIMGFVLNLGGMPAVLVFMAISYMAGILVYPILQNTFIDKIQNNHATENASKLYTKKKKTNLWPLFIGLCFLTLQIAAFNFLIPLIAQHEKNWSATEFGLIDAMAGIGAFICTVISLESGWKKSLWLVTFLIVPLADFCFYFFQNAHFVAMIATFLGFFVNVFWIKSREFIYASVNETKEFMLWIARVTVMAVLLKAAAPIALTMMPTTPSFSFFLIGLIAGLGMLISTLILIKRNYHAKLRAYN